jgi:hypothetical protein
MVRKDTDEDRTAVICSHASLRRILCTHADDVDERWDDVRCAISHHQPSVKTATRRPTSFNE